MNERPSAGSGVVGYVIVLVGVAAFILSCFLPFTPLGQQSFSYYQLVTMGDGTINYVGGLLFLFGGAGTIAWVAFAGLRHGLHERRRTPSILVAVTVVWSSAWIGALVSVSGDLGYEAGYWSMLVSTGVVVVGTIVVWVSARQATQATDSAAGPEPPTEVPVGRPARLRRAARQKAPSVRPPAASRRVLIGASGPPRIDQQLGEGAFRAQVAEACREQLQPSSLSGFRTGEPGAYGGEGGRMIAAISIGIIIIIAVIIAALALVYFVLKGSPR